MKTLDAEELKNTDRLKIYIFGNDSRRQARVVASLDNLGKGAAGACVQNLNAMLGRPETAGVVLLRWGGPGGNAHRGRQKGKCPRWKSYLPFPHAPANWPLFSAWA